MPPPNEEELAAHIVEFAAHENPGEERCEDSHDEDSLEIVLLADACEGDEALAEQEPEQEAPATEPEHEAPTGEQDTDLRKLQQFMALRLIHGFCACEMNTFGRGIPLVFFFACALFFPGMLMYESV